MKRIAFFIVLFLVLKVKLSAQLSCPEVIYICNGYNEITFDGVNEITNFTIKVTQNSGPINFFFKLISIKDNTVIFEVNLSLIGSADYELTYTVTGPDGNACWGSAVLSETTELTYFNYDCIDQNTGAPDFNCGFENSSYFTIKACEGDTIVLTSKNNLGDLVYLDGDMISSSLGRVVELKKGEVKMYWENSGTECMKLFQDNCPTKLYSVIILPKQKMKIENKTGTTNICSNQTLDLFTQDQGDYKWTISDGRTSEVANLHLKFSTPGNYEIILYDKDKCNCRIADTLSITVTAGNRPSLFCYGTACEDTEVTYFSDQTCQPFIWSFSQNATILEGGKSTDAFVKIKWESGDEGTISLSTPGCSINSCAETSNFTIPVIPKKIKIKGDTIICSFEKSIYSTKEFEGSKNNWSIKKGNVLSAWQLNSNSFEITTKNPNGTVDTILLNVKLENCNLECNSFGEIKILSKGTLKIEGLKSSYCKNSDLLLTNPDNSILEWSLIDDKGNLVEKVSSQTFNKKISTTGRYKIFVKDLSLIYCNPELSFDFEVLESPVNNAIIDGPLNVCSGSISTYTVTNPDSRYSYLWQIYSGNTVSPILTLKNTSVDYLWGNAGYKKISLIMIDKISGCESEAIEIFPKSESGIIIGDNSCISTKKKYELLTNNGSKVNWSIEPPNAGAITYQNEKVVDIIWLLPGSHKVKANQCNLDGELIVSIYKPIKPDITFDNPICLGQKSQLNVNGAFALLEITDSTKTKVLSNSSPYFANAGEYFIRTKDIYQCSYDTAIVIKSYEVERPEISVNNFRTFCNFDYPLTLVSNKLLGIYTFNWYKNGNPINEHNVDLIINDFGSYHLEIIDSHNCSSISNEIIISKSCGNGSPQCNARRIGLFDCNNNEYEVAPPFNSTRFTWDFDDVDAQGNIVSGNPVRHVFSKAGYFQVIVTGDKGEVGLFIEEVPAAAEFAVKNLCLSDSTGFINTSSLLHNKSEYTYLWDFGDPASGILNSSTLSDPFHKYSAVGEFTVTLKINHANTPCVSTFQNVIKIEDNSLTILSKDLTCLGDSIKFSVNPASDIKSIYWDFDTSKPNQFTSKELSPVIYFNESRQFDVAVTVVKNNGCVINTSKKVSVNSNNISGNITSNIPLPKCNNIPAILTGPTGNYTYKWSTNENTRSIAVFKADEYKLTITDDYGCVYVPDPILVNNQAVEDNYIFGYKKNIEDEIFIDSMEICLGESVELSTQPGTYWYLWSTLSFNQSIQPFSGKPPVGRHRYNLVVTDYTTGCINITEPFYLIVHPNPIQPIITLTSGTGCEGVNNTLSVTNVENKVNYLWNDLTQGINYSTSNQGINYLAAKNEFGCTAKTSKYINSKPNIDSWLSGCIEACLPKSLCMNLSNFYSYSLFKDGKFIKTIPGNIGNISIDSIGDYKLKVKYGNCENESDILSVIASPIDHKLKGNVFLDNNKNDTFDIGIDKWLDGVKINIYLGNSIIDYTFTDSSGFYTFDSVKYANVYVGVDPSETKFYEGNADSIVQYNDCKEIKKIDFKFVKNCFPISSSLNKTICPGESLTIAGITYNTPVLDTIYLQNEYGCDSLIFLEILQTLSPDVLVDRSFSCLSQSVGSIIVNYKIQDSLLFSLDGGIFSNKAAFENLSSGKYNLKIKDKNSCISSFEIDINNAPEITTNVDTKYSCAKAGNGSIQFLSTDKSLLYFVDNQLVGEFVENLKQGVYNLRVLDTFGCEINQVINIENYPIPDIDIETKGACNQNYGTMEIKAISNENQFSISGNNYAEDLFYDSLSVGNYNLFIIDKNSCKDTIPFSIIQQPKPDFTVKNKASCLNQNSGSIEIISNSNLLYKINVNDNYLNQNKFEFLQEDSYTLFIKDQAGCEYKENFSITSDTITTSEITVKAACDGIANGEIVAINETVDMSYKIKGSNNWIDSLHFQNLKNDSYTVYFQNGNGCLDSLIADIPVFDKTILLIDIKSNCENENNAEVVISSSENIVSSLDGVNFYFENKFTDLKEGDYELTYKNDNGCVGKENFNVSKIKKPELTLNLENTCANENKGILMMKGMTAGQQAIFNNIIIYQDTILNNLTAQPYKLFLKDQHCLFEYDASISSLSIPEFDVSSDATCPNQKSGKISLFSSEALDYTLNGKPILNETSDLKEGKYKIIAKGSNGCITEKDLEITKLPELDVEFPDIQELCVFSGDTILPQVRSSAGNVKYVWQDSSEDPYYVLRDANVNLVNVAVSDICSTRARSWQVEVVNEDIDKIIYIPNIFAASAKSPNNCFKGVYTKNIEKIISYKLNIYDRWGNLIYKTNNSEDCWDGTFNGRPCEQGVYAYILDTTVSICGLIKSERVVRDVTLVR